MMIYICLVLTAIFVIRSDAFEDPLPYRLEIPEAMHSPINKRPFKPDCSYVCHTDPEQTPLFSIGGTDVKPQENDPFYGDAYIKNKRLYKPLFGKLFGFEDKTQRQPKLAPLLFNSNT